MIDLERLLSVPTWLRMRLAGTSLANAYARLNARVYLATQGKLWKNLCVPETGELVPILLLETRGRRTGQLRVTPLIYCRQGGRFLLAAANAGHDCHPSWFLNLRSEPHVHVRIGANRFPAFARVALPGEEEVAFEAFAAAYPPLLRYNEATSRAIPMVFIEVEEKNEVEETNAGRQPRQSWSSPSEPWLEPG